MRARRLPITTVRPGDVVSIHLRGRVSERINSYGGRVNEADAIAVRINASWSRFGVWPTETSGEIVIPWSRIDRIRIETPATIGGAR